MTSPKTRPALHDHNNLTARNGRPSECQCTTHGPLKPFRSRLLIFLRQSLVASIRLLHLPKMHFSLTSAFTAATLLQLSLAAYPAGHDKPAPQYSAAPYHPEPYHAEPYKSKPYHSDSHHPAPYHSGPDHDDDDHYDEDHDEDGHSKKHKHCTAGKKHCGYGCHEWFGRCYCPPKSRPGPFAVAPVSTNGRCGGRSGASCAGSVFGDCCKYVVTTLTRCR
jgi:hypothetical protein